MNSSELEERFNTGRNFVIVMTNPKIQTVENARTSLLLLKSDAIEQLINILLHEFKAHAERMTRDIEALTPTSDHENYNGIGGISGTSGDRDRYPADSDAGKVRDQIRESIKFFKEKIQQDGLNELKLRQTA